MFTRRTNVGCRCRGTVIYGPLQPSEYVLSVHTLQAFFQRAPGKGCRRGKYIVCTSGKQPPTHLPNHPPVPRVKRNAEGHVEDEQEQHDEHEGCMPAMESVVGRVKFLLRPLRLVVEGIVVLLRPIQQYFVCLCQLFWTFCSAEKKKEAETKLYITAASSSLGHRSYICAVSLRRGSTCVHITRGISH